MYRYVASLLGGWFGWVEGWVRENLAEAESVLLERALPVTVGGRKGKRRMEEEEEEEED